MADDVQPQAGQGGEGTGIFDSYLNAVPEDGRETVTAYLKDAEKHVNERIAEAAELKKQWEPYSYIENLPPPEQLSELLTWSNQTLTSQETFDQWVQETAEAKGMTKAESEDLVEETEGLSPEQIQQIADERAQQMLSPFQEELREMQQERGIDIESQAIREALGNLEKEAKVELSESQRAMVIDLGMPASVDEKGEDLPVGDTSWIGVGFERFKEITTEGQRAFVEAKTAQPAAAMTTGGAPMLKPVTTFEDARAALRERLAQDKT